MRLRDVGRSDVRLAGFVALTVLLYLGLVLTAAWDLPLAWALTLLAVTGLERLVDRKAPVLERLLDVGALGPNARSLVQVLTFGVLVARHFPEWDGGFVAFMVVLVLLPVSRSAYLVGLFVRKVRLVRPIEVRNIDLGPLANPPLPAWAYALDEPAAVQLGAIPLVVGAVGVDRGVIWPFVVLTLVYALPLLAAAILTLLRALGRGGHLGNPEWERRALQRIRALQPRAVFYFSGSPEAIYQANMWLRPMAELDRDVLVMLRERSLMKRLEPTDLPVVCMPDSVTVMNAKISSAKVAFYAAHTGKTIHLLREPGLRHVFIGHGDSDKVSSVNPFAKVYDELWVAGRAARDRWAKAGVGVRDDAVVEVGRPQLVAVDRTPHPATSGPWTVLYAPTWEGWTDQDFGTSVTDMGPVLVGQLLAADPPWRVIYKPHPFTGQRDKRTRQAHELIVAMIAKANAAQGTPPHDDGLAALTEELARRDLTLAEHEELSARWHEAYWGQQADQGHLVVTGPRPGLFSCFNHADLMIADVSSVVSDFLASGKPYVCANPQGFETDRFHRENPSTEAAYLLGPDCAELPEILATVRAADPLAGRRRQLREYLLGADEPPSIDRWRAALDRLAATVHTGQTAGLDPDLMDFADE